MTLPGAIAFDSWDQLCLAQSVSFSNIFNRISAFDGSRINPLDEASLVLDGTPDDIAKNLHTFDSLNVFYEAGVGNFADYTLPSVFDKLADSSSKVHRFEVIKQFKFALWLLKIGGIELCQRLSTKAETLSMVQGGFTAGSTTSEASIYA
ncbi:aryl-alcohol oxidase 3 [Asimina triloba]